MCRTSTLLSTLENVIIFRKHVGAELTLAKDEFGLDIELDFCKNIVRWVGHLWRHPASIATKLVQHQSDAWLQQRRDADSANRPRTWTEPGSVFLWASA